MADEVMDDEQIEEELMSTRQERFAEIIGAHRAYLNQFDPRHLESWERLLSQNDEAAICEARWCQILRAQGVGVIPNEDLFMRSRAPDFRCERYGRKFYVEVTCAVIENMDRNTPIPHSSERGVFPAGHADFIRCVVRKVQEKVDQGQCANLDAPCLVALGTLHSWTFSYLGRETMAMLQTGLQYISQDIVPRTGERSPPYIASKLEDSLFLFEDEDDGGIKTGRIDISAVLVATVGSGTPTVVGFLHPSPTRPFDHTLLPDVDFCQLQAGYDSGVFSVAWTGSIIATNDADQ